ncbi:hypothetical protein PGT21_003421 [Puccinia graminis f. sp. tritici]|uniref:Uncharacterized protein n=1 Tax=Puccinia graminis f. sp. tritici TaxID=56615 RepID=A0A5B0M7R8_PUCGR|nr:hypothetical protein PGT21_003421 [Puccinia graminis f. sp. tritici]
MTSTTSPSESPTNQPEAVQPTKEIFRVPFWTRRLLSNKDEDHEIAYSNLVNEESLRLRLN